ncbi:small GTP-binding protein domain-containing protein [Bacillus sp. OV166]|uniref:GTPase n=1 Tax=Bacillus sp. OV166 TaxID=1882763 RepID=UPI000A2ADF9F|nr:GTPase [Bacillus sp. OV166]SMQ77552.1 small GTP-binding protein domain-containing protein [Bacillus sp. OV166]
MENQEWDKELDEILKDLGVDGSPIDAIHEKLKNEFDKVLNIGFIGSPGVGKSTLMNKIAGRKIADSGVNPGVKVTPFAWGENDSIVFWDLPGYNGLPKEHNVEQYWEFHNLEEMDILICMFSNKLTEDDAHFFKLAIQHAQDVIFVRSKSDDIYDDELSVEELKAEIEETYIKKLFGPQFTLLFVSSRTGEGLAELQDTIANRLSSDLQEKFYRNAKAYSQSFLVAKEKASLKTVLWYSTLSAGAGLVPVGAGILIDIPSNIKMIKAIGNHFALTPKRLALLEEQETEKMKEYNVFLNVLKHGIGAKELYLPLLKRFAPEVVAARAGQIIPVLGAGAGFSLTFFMGKRAINSCKVIAQDILEKEIEAINGTLVH